MGAGRNVGTGVGDGLGVSSSVAMEQVYWWDRVSVGIAVGAEWPFPGIIRITAGGVGVPVAVGFNRNRRR